GTQLGFPQARATSPHQFLSRLTLARCGSVLGKIRSCPTHARILKPSPHPQETWGRHPCSEGPGAGEAAVAPEASRPSLGAVPRDRRRNGAVVTPPPGQTPSAVSALAGKQPLEQALSLSTLASLTLGRVSGGVLRSASDRLPPWGATRGAEGETRQTCSAGGGRGISGAAAECGAAVRRLRVLTLPRHSPAGALVGAQHSMAAASFVQEMRSVGERLLVKLQRLPQADTVELLAFSIIVIFIGTVLLLVVLACSYCCVRCCCPEQRGRRVQVQPVKPREGR
uniref:Small integral membrane protein 5 n=1 Tax=Oryctolagus cuniculus TaxID=9986 RepID=A0A5F9DBN6_RABIT